MERDREFDNTMDRMEEESTRDVRQPMGNNQMGSSQWSQESQSMYGYSEGYEHQQSYNQPYFYGQSYQDQPYQDQPYQDQPYQDQSYQGMNPPPTKEVEKKKKKKFPMFAKVACIVVLGMGVGIALFCMTSVMGKEGGLPSFSGQQGSIFPKETTPPKNEGEDSSSGSNITIEQTKVDNPVKDTGVSSVVESVMPSIVTISSTFESQNYFGQVYESIGSGSGIIIKQTDKSLLVATNYHVVQDASQISVTFHDDEAVNATVRGYDSDADLAVLEILLSSVKETTMKSIKIATLGDSSEAKVGEMAVAIGNALGYGQSVTVGYISAKDRTVDVEGTKMVLLQTDAAINPGNSGGALLNLKGEVIGINSVKFSSEEVEGMGYAIPVSSAMPIIEELMNREQLTDDEKGYLGISGSSVDEQGNQYYNIPYGVLVVEVKEGGAADLAGIKPNDVITKINGIEVASINSLAERVNNYRKDTKVTITLKRMTDGKYKEQEVTVTLQGKEAIDGLSTDSPMEGEQGVTPNN